MSLGDDGYSGNGQDSGRSGGEYRDYGDRHLTRTRLPEGEGDPYAPARRGGRGGRGGGRAGMSSRNLVTVVGVVVLLIAAIAFANRGGGDSASDDSEKDGGRTASAQPTVPTGTRPVGGKTAGIASGFAHTEQGAQSAAANFAVALGGDGMFKADSRHAIVSSIHTPDTAPALEKELDKAYTEGFFKNLGLKPDGTAPKGQTFVSRTVPVGSKTTAYKDDEATVEVWCTGLVGLAGEGSTRPVTQTWFTLTQKLRWVDNDWKISSSSQKQGPAPVGGDVQASTADEINNAISGYGGFTYAR
ncbi:hypothetical protein [Streptomyces albireticuli]|uniref:DUF8175 domain-containing protein n=1 Tax=Streptomyces albireticuli TaxID=1940 RepID=A0A2A2DGW9_9ACTN|nr:hypothetical protein [Streptomyces albireticuli]MCD9143121.1 hypothetical protein [Streptomyces albireticuli]MCD9165364.1 hypothetical protein [Streptomyces albireticuli]MCD9192118.1 hypothetical protein [Streptomyces albireticuli]PAU50784.1 hypothetical protein CK936_00695 [Streptomyces albireticuli]